MKPAHLNLANGRWYELTLPEQLGNVGSEVNRALMFKDKDAERYKSSSKKALELLDLTISDRRWRERLKEIVRAREVLCDALYGGKSANELESLNKYFYHFAYAARIGK